MYNILLETSWWGIYNASLIVGICLVIHKILANKAFIVTDTLISQLFVVAFVYLLQLKDLRVDQWIESYIGLTQENLIENSV